MFEGRSEQGSVAGKFVVTSLSLFRETQSNIFTT
jgi:hypothetical protein